MSTQTKKLSESTVVQSIAEADKIPIVNSSGQTVLVPLSGLLGAIKVGGRNLVKNSGVEISTNTDLITTYLYGEDKPEAGEKLVVSVWAELGPNVKAMTFFSQHTEGSSDSFSILPTDIKRDGRYVKQFTATKKPYRIIVYQGPGLSDNSTISRIKIERGNIPTDWIPAPEDWGGVKTSLSAVCAFTAQLSKQKGGSHEPNEGLDEYSAQGNTPGCYDVSRGCGVSGKLYPGGILLNQFRHYIHQSTQYPGLAVRNPGSLIARRRSDTTHNEHLCRLHNRQSISARLLAAVAPNCHDRDIAARKEVAV